MNAKRCFKLIVGRSILQSKAGRNGKVDLVGTEVAKKVVVIETRGASGIEGGDASGGSDGQPKPAGLNNQVVRSKLA